MTEREAKIADKINNARQIARAIQGEVELLNPTYEPEIEGVKRIIAGLVRIEELGAEAVQLLRDEA